MIDDEMTAAELGAELASDYIRVERDKRNRWRWRAQHLGGDTVPVPAYALAILTAYDGESCGSDDWEAQMQEAWAARTARMALLRRMPERDVEIVASWCGPQMTVRTLSDIMLLIGATTSTASVRRVDGESRTTISLCTRDDSIDGAGPTLAEAVADAVRMLARRAW